MVKAEEDEEGFSSETSNPHRDRGSFDRNSLDRNCVLSDDRNFYNQLTEIFGTFHLIEFLKPNLTWPNLT